MTFQKNALVTGAAQGIGFATAKQLASHGVNVVLADCDEEKLNEACAALAGSEGRILGKVCDVRAEEAVHACAAYAEAELGGVDILVNNAGIFRLDCGIPFEDTASSMWKTKIDINILGTMYFTHALIKGMLQRGYGRIVNLASVAAVFGLSGMVDYSMTKGAVVGFTKALAREVTGRGVCVNAVSPGLIGERNDIESDWNSIHRQGSFEECANLICFLASDEASYISGQNYVIDGQRRLIR